ncbi:MAG TPA: MGMT family protein [Candidatus Hydrogenedentes bacterium]|nr:MGMT family protein [Candidatus Hydrogenedentota bacterium]HNT88339.1 MGMT family protein [Candidatus Hydrogenedentota bacterium]
MSNFYEAVYRVVREIPPGRVMTYGQIATLLGCPRAARAVGYAMRASGPRNDVPWHRVINGRGAISARGEVERPILQRLLLEAEGVRFDATETCDLARCRWEPPNPDDYLFLPDRDWPFA